MADPRDDVAPGEDPILVLARSVEALAGQVEAQTSTLSTAVQQFDKALAAHRRSTWIAYTALAIAVALVAAILGFGVWQVRTTQQNACESGNAVRASVIRAAEVALTGTARRLGDGTMSPDAQDDLVAGLIAEIAADPALQPRECPSSLFP